MKISANRLFVILCFFVNIAFANQDISSPSQDISKFQHQQYNKIYTGSDIKKLIINNDKKNNENIVIGSSHLKADSESDIKNFLPLEDQKLYLISSMSSYIHNWNGPGDDLQCYDNNHIKYCLCDQFELEIKGSFQKNLKMNNFKFLANDDRFFCETKTYLSYECFFVKDLEEKYVVDHDNLFIQACTQDYQKITRNFIDPNNICKNAKRILENKKIFYDCTEF